MFRIPSLWNISFSALKMVLEKTKIIFCFPEIYWVIIIILVQMLDFPFNRSEGHWFYIKVHHFTAFIINFRNKTGFKNSINLFSFLKQCVWNYTKNISGKKTIIISICDMYATIFTISGIQWRISSWQVALIK